MKSRRHSTAAMMLILSLCMAPLSLAQGKQDAKGMQSRMTEEVRRELIMLPNYSLFDYLEFQIVDVDTVVLMGQVTKPILKRDAENAVQKLERVGKVVNKIEVLPVSPQDDRIRVAAYRAIFSKSGLERYGQMAVPPIHIIVNSGRITLVGTVDNQMDKDLAGLAVQGVPLTFGVTNNLNVRK